MRSRLRLLSRWFLLRSAAFVSDGFFGFSDPGEFALQFFQSLFLVDWELPGAFLYGFKFPDPLLNFVRVSVSEAFGSLGGNGSLSYSLFKG
jgi:hypothetical protein